MSPPVPTISMAPADQRPTPGSIARARNARANAATSAAVSPLSASAIRNAAFASSASAGEASATAAISTSFADNSLSVLNLPVSSLSSDMDTHGIEKPPRVGSINSTASRCCVTKRPCDVLFFYWDSASAWASPRSPARPMPLRRNLWPNSPPAMPSSSVWSKALRNSSRFHPPVTSSSPIMPSRSKARPRCAMPPATRSGTNHPRPNTPTEFPSPSNSPPTPTRSSFKPVPSPPWS